MTAPDTSQFTPEREAEIWSTLQAMANSIQDEQTRRRYLARWRKDYEAVFPAWNAPDAQGVYAFVHPDDVSFSIIDPSDWHGQEPPAREWMLDNWLPQRRAAYITGAGGAGKSLFGQQLATCIAMGLPFLGIDTAHAPAIYLTAEDDADELQRRQRAICRALGTPEARLRGQLFHISLFGETANEMVTFEREGGMQLASAWKKLISTARITRARFIVLDNVSHLFAGNEVDRAQVTAFANLLNSLAQEIDGVVLLIGHPNKAGARGPYGPPVGRTGQRQDRTLRWARPGPSGRAGGGATGRVLFRRRHQGTGRVDLCRDGSHHHGNPKRAGRNGEGVLVPHEVFLERRSALSTSNPAGSASRHDPGIGAAPLGARRLQRRRCYPWAARPGRQRYCRNQSDRPIAQWRQ